MGKHQDWSVVVVVVVVVLAALEVFARSVYGNHPGMPGRARLTPHQRPWRAERRASAERDAREHHENRVRAQRESTGMLEQIRAAETRAENTAGAYIAAQPWPASPSPGADVPWGPATGGWLTLGTVAPSERAFCQYTVFTGHAGEKPPVFRRGYFPGEHIRIGEMSTRWESSDWWAASAICFAGGDTRETWVVVNPSANFDGTYVDGWSER